MSAPYAVRGFGPSRFPAATGPASQADTSLTSIPSVGTDDHGGQLLHPANPMLAFGAIAAVVFGLMAFSTSIRVGKARGSISIGDTT